MTFAEMIAASRKNLKARADTTTQKSTSKPSSPVQAKEDKELPKIEEEDAN